MGQMTHAAREQLADELYRRYVTEARGTAGLRRKLRYWRKRYMWIAVVSGTRLLKRTIDVVGSQTALILGFPVLILVALLIKLTDGGPILFWQTRVGFRGREFPFPKFRSMVINAERLKQGLLEQNDHDNSITFKMKRDPRITWIGRIIRKLSVDELHITLQNLNSYNVGRFEASP